MKRASTIMKTFGGQSPPAVVRIHRHRLVGKLRFACDPRVPSFLAPRIYSSIALQVQAAGPVCASATDQSFRPASSSSTFRLVCAGIKAPGAGGNTSHATVLVIIH
jgi:hypothetical protein